MYIIPKKWAEPHDNACVICFFGYYQICPPGGQKNAFFGSSSTHRQDRPQVYYTKMTGYLDIHETFLFQTSNQLMVAILNFANFGSSSAHRQD